MPHLLSAETENKVDQTAKDSTVSSGQRKKAKRVKRKRAAPKQRARKAVTRSYSRALLHAECVDLESDVSEEQLE